MKRAWLLAILAACNNVDGGSVNGKTVSDVDIPDRDPDITETGNLSTGAQIDLDWADDSGIVCFPGNENVNFTGNHVFFTEEKQGAEDIYIVVDPDAGVDTSFYVLEFVDEVQTPPDITSQPRCEAEYDQTNDHNPGSPEAVTLQGFPDKKMLIGVAGANGATEGAFTLSIWLGEADFDTE
jgi:hypothetical protein